MRPMPVALLFLSGYDVAMTPEAPANSPLFPKVLLLTAAVLFVLLQGRLWLSDDGWPEVVRLRASVGAQEAENARHAQRNDRLRAEVSDLKTGFAALEERARADLGMIGQRESFFLWSPADTAQNLSANNDN